MATNQPVFILLQLRQLQGIVTIAAQNQIVDEVEPGTGAGEKYRIHILLADEALKNIMNSFAQIVDVAATDFVFENLSGNSMVLVLVTREFLFIGRHRRS